MQTSVATRSLNQRPSALFDSGGRPSSALTRSSSLAVSTEYSSNNERSSTIMVVTWNTCTAHNKQCNNTVIAVAEQRFSLEAPPPAHAAAEEFGRVVHHKQLTVVTVFSKLSLLVLYGEKNATAAR